MADRLIPIPADTESAPDADTPVARGGASEIGVRGIFDGSKAKDARRAVALGFVHLEGDSRPAKDKEYRVVSADSFELEALPIPDTAQQFLDINIYSFFAGDLPEGIFGGRNEGLLKVQALTANPEDFADKEARASFVRDFRVKDDEYAPGFLFAGVFRNLLISSRANIGFDLFELDKDASESFSRFKAVIDRVPEVKNLDIIKGIPYLGLATGLADAVIDVFGKNADDRVWGEIPILETDPLIGGAFLRSGIYVIIEKERDGVELDFEDLSFKNLEVSHKPGKKLGAHLVFGTRLRPFEKD